MKEVFVAAAGDCCCGSVAGASAPTQGGSPSHLPTFDHVVSIEPDPGAAGYCSDGPPTTLPSTWRSWIPRTRRPIEVDGPKPSFTPDLTRSSDLPGYLAVIRQSVPGAGLPSTEFSITSLNWARLPGSSSSIQSMVRQRAPGFLAPNPESRFQMI